MLFYFVATNLLGRFARLCDLSVSLSVHVPVRCSSESRDSGRNLLGSKAPSHTEHDGCGVHMLQLSSEEIKRAVPKTSVS